MVRRPAAVADALLLLLIVFQCIARARSTKDAAAPPAVVPPPRDGKDALAAEAGLRGGVGDPELVFIGVANHCGRGAVFTIVLCSSDCWLLPALPGPSVRNDWLVLVLLLKASSAAPPRFDEAPLLSALPR